MGILRDGNGSAPLKESAEAAELPETIIPDRAGGTRRLFVTGSYGFPEAAGGLQDGGAVD
jgi:hypothetical protein